MIAWLRSWLAGFGHPTTTQRLNDKVTWTVPKRLFYPAESPEQFITRLNADEDHTDDGDGRWELVGFVETVEGTTVRLVRTDGRYRWRDDGMRGL